MDPRLAPSLPDRASPAGTAPVPWWGGWLVLLAGPLVLALGFAFARTLPSPVARAAQAPKIAPPADKLPAHLCAGWDNPDLVLVVSGQTHGYLQPCGCSEPQMGGLTRRYNLIQLLKKKGWDVAGIDLGDLYPKGTEIQGQAKEKYKTTLRALSVMGYRAYGIGELELKMPLIGGLAEAAALNLKTPIPLALNLADPDKVYDALGVRQYEILGDKVKVGLTSMIGASLANLHKGPNLQFFPNSSILPKALDQFAKNQVDVTILIYHGSTERKDGQPPPVEVEVRTCAKWCAELKQKNDALPAVDLILHPSDFDTPPGRPDPIKDVKHTVAQIMGHSGKYVSLVGLFKKGNGYELKYQLVEMDPEFATPRGEHKDHPVEKILEEYADTVKNSNFLAAFGALRQSHLSQRQLLNQNKGIDARYVGSERCGSCHAKAYQIWTKTGHSKAFAALTKAEHPSNRQFDPECIKCHVTGFQYKGGYFDPPAGANPVQAEKHNQKLLDVGCESCHGPASMHSNDHTNKAYYPLINPLKLKGPPSEIKLDAFCQSCHDIDNDVHWGNKQFKNSWLKIAHPTK